MLNYKVYNEGKNEWVVFVHGISGDMSTWNDHIDFFKPYYNILLLDLPWHGKSKINRRLTRQILNQEIKDVLDKVGVKKAHFVGLSLGSIVIAQFLLRYPKYVHKAVFVASAIQASAFCNLIVSIAQPLKYVLPYTLIYNLGVSLVVPKDESNVSRKIFCDGFKRMGRSRLIEWVSYLSVVLDGKETIRKLSKLNKECFFISGEHDSFFLEGAIDSANVLANGNIEIMKDCTHVCNADNKKLFNEKTLNFLLNSPA